MVFSNIFKKNLTNSHGASWKCSCNQWAFLYKMIQCTDIQLKYHSAFSDKRNYMTLHGRFIFTVINMCHVLRPLEHKEVFLRKLVKFQWITFYYVVHILSSTVNKIKGLSNNLKILDILFEFLLSLQKQMLSAIALLRTSLNSFTRNDTQKLKCIWNF